MHKKIQQISKKWPIARKEKVYVVVPSHTHFMPLLVIMRDILKLGKNKKEIRRILSSGSVKINGKIIKDYKQPAQLFDIITLGDKKYKMVLTNKGKYKLEETKDNEKISKVIGKKVLKTGLVQVNLNDGRNIISKEKVNVGDSVIIKEKGIEVIKLQDNCKVLILEGRHSGAIGKVKKIEEKFARISLDGKEFDVLKKLIMAI